MARQRKADADAQRQRAEGERALAMVPVDVQRAKVAIERERLETVLKPELQAREVHGKVAQDFELKKLHIEAERTVRIATADASASMFTKMEAKLFGTPEDVQKMLRSVLDGQGAAHSINAFFDTTEGKAEQTVSRLTNGLEQLATAAATRLTGEQDAAE